MKIFGFVVVFAAALCFHPFCHAMDPRNTTLGAFFAEPSGFEPPSVHARTPRTPAPDERHAVIHLPGGPYREVIPEDEYEDEDDRSTFGDSRFSEATDSMMSLETPYYNYRWSMSVPYLLNVWLAEFLDVNPQVNGLHSLFNGFEANLAGTAAAEVSPNLLYAYARLLGVLTPTSSSVSEAITLFQYVIDHHANAEELVEMAQQHVAYYSYQELTRTVPFAEDARFSRLVQTLRALRSSSTEAQVLYQLFLRIPPGAHPPRNTLSRVFWTLQEGGARWQSATNQHLRIFLRSLLGERGLPETTTRGSMVTVLHALISLLQARLLSAVEHNVYAIWQQELIHLLVLYKQKLERAQWLRRLQRFVCGTTRVQAYAETPNTISLLVRYHSTQNTAAVVDQPNHHNAHLWYSEVLPDDRPDSLSITRSHSSGTTY